MPISKDDVKLVVQGSMHENINEHAHCSALPEGTVRKEACRKGLGF